MSIAIQNYDRLHAIKVYISKEYLILHILYKASNQYKINIDLLGVQLIISTCRMVCTLNGYEHHSIIVANPANHKKSLIKSVIDILYQRRQ